MICRALLADETRARRNCCAPCDSHTCISSVDEPSLPVAIATAPTMTAAPASYMYAPNYSWPYAAARRLCAAVQSQVNPNSISSTLRHCHFPPLSPAWRPMCPWNTMWIQSCSGGDTLCPTNRCAAALTCLPSAPHPAAHQGRAGAARDPRLACLEVLEAQGRHSECGGIAKRIWMHHCAGACASQQQSTARGLSAPSTHAGCEQPRGGRRVWGPTAAACCTG